MTVTIESAVATLQDPKTPLVDRGLLKPGGRDEVLAKIRQYESKDLRAKVVIDELGDSFTEYLGIWGKLGLDPKKDLLLIYNGADLAARGWGLDDDEIKRGLAAAKAAHRRTNAQVLTTALDDLGTLATQKIDRGTNLAPVIGGGVGVVAIGGVLGLAIHRRNKLAKEGKVAIQQAKASAERAYSELMLACEELTGNDGTELQLKAAELKKRMDAVVQEAEASPAKKSDPVTLGKIRQFENEFAALRSTSLQKARN
jgi:hypothetical protein